MVNDKDTIDLRYETKYSEGVNVKAIEKELRSKIEGEVRFDTGTKALYATDASNYRQVPIGVVLPKAKKISSIRLRYVKNIMRRFYRAVAAQVLPAPAAMLPL